MHRHDPAAFLIAFALLVGLASTSGPAHAGDPDTPHHHQGYFPAISADPGPIKLNADEKAQLASGKLVQQQIQDEDSGWGSAAMLVNAPPGTIWDTILDYDRYVDRVKNVESCTVYKRDGTTLWVDMHSELLGREFHVYTVNDVNRDQGWMSWTLDYSRTSDVYDLVGHWRVEEISADPPVSRLDYSTRIKIRGVPGFILNGLAKSALEDGTAWVKKHSEAAAR